MNIHDDHIGAVFLGDGQYLQVRDCGFDLCLNRAPFSGLSGHEGVRVPLALPAPNGGDFGRITTSGGERRFVFNGRLNF